MKVSISKSKNTTIYYLSKSVRVGNKTTTKTVEKIGTYDEINKNCGDMDPLDWAKQYAAQRTAEEKKAKQDILVRYSSTSLIDKDSRRSCNIGYLFLQDIYYSLGLKNICNTVSDNYKFSYDLNEILSTLVYSRILTPGSKRLHCLMHKGSLNSQKLIFIRFIERWKSLQMTTTSFSPSYIRILRT